jgi:hypothetical protein
LKVSTTFRNAIRWGGTVNEERLPKIVKLKLKYGGPRYATMGNKIRANRR